MKSFPGTMWLTLAAMAAVVTLAQVAEAQRGEGRGGGPGFRGPMGGGFGISSVQLAAMPRVQEALDLSTDQKETVAEINGQLREQRREGFGRGERDFGQLRAEMERLNSEAAARLAETLDETQQKRLAGIAIRVNDAGALADPLVAAELDLSEEQQASVSEIRQSQGRAMREQRGELRDLSAEDRRAKMEQWRAESNAELAAVMTSDQRSTFDTLKADAEDIELSRLRGPGGSRGVDGPPRRGDRERRGERRRDRGERDSDN